MTNYGAEGIGDTNHQGYIKCKLAHGLGYSVVLPDVLLVGVKGGKWIQPLAFGPNVLTKMDKGIVCSISVDISCGHRLMVRFGNRDLVSRLADGSELYRCSINGPASLEDFATGDSFLSVENVPYLRLYHHTSVDAKQKIQDSGEFWGSKWNIQGTSKTLTNVAYVYFTSLHEVNHIDDLTLIAMASSGKLTFIIDVFTPPAFLPQGWEDKYRSEILVLPVYRASTADRTATLHFDVESTLLAPQHLLRHAPVGDAVWFEVATPFVQRIAIQPATTLRFDGQAIDSACVDRKHFEYVVIGDATSVAGLAAPYDEEDTTFILKIERPESGSNILEFWFEHSNRDLYSGKVIELQSFDQ
jgi:hypothetical protein